MSEWGPAGAPTISQWAAATVTHFGREVISLSIHHILKKPKKKKKTQLQNTFLIFLEILCSVVDEIFK